MNKENIEKIVSGVASKYEGLLISRVLDELKRELNDVLNEYLQANYVTTEDFPIIGENSVGHWEIHQDGTAYVQPKVVTQYIECNITIKKTGEIEHE
jgi:hypothetical protein